MPGAPGVAVLDASAFTLTLLDTFPVEADPADSFNAIRGKKALSVDGNLDRRLRSSSLMYSLEILAPAQGLMRRKVRLGMTLSRKLRSFKRRRWASPNLIDRGIYLSSSESESSSVSWLVAAGRFFGSTLLVAYWRRPESGSICRGFVILAVGSISIYN